MHNPEFEIKKFIWILREITFLGMYRKPLNFDK
jgi:hypothetical protein